jgi:hypothetical protein
MSHSLQKILKISVFSLLALQLSGCGYILYPDRRGQTGGQVDVGVAVLDGIGLFFFLIPGIVAYAVDFSSGTIYLPHSRSRHGSLDMKVVHFDPKERSLERLSQLIRQASGRDSGLERKDMRAYKLASLAEMKQRLASFQTQQEVQLASASGERR